MFQLVILLIALFAGYQIKRLYIPQLLLNKVLFIIAIVILVVMGYQFGSSASDLWLQLLQVLKNVVVFASLIFICNILLTMLFFRRTNQQLRHPEHEQIQANYAQFAYESGKYLAMIALGICVGYLLKLPLVHLEAIVNWLLIILLFIIGHQMRMNGVSLKEVLLNKTGFKLSCVIVIASLVAGGLSAVILGMPIMQGIALSSGFGWYTLSSILIGQLINQDYGTTAFFIDFSRELIAIILLPSLGRFIPLSMVGYCGATAMDFSLPIIKQNLDHKCVIIAISSGMLLSCAVPLLIPLVIKFI